MRLIWFHLFYNYSLFYPFSFVYPSNTNEPTNLFIHEFLSLPSLSRSFANNPKRTKISSSIFPRSEKLPHTRQNELEHHRGIKGGQRQGGCRGTGRRRRRRSAVTLTNKGSTDSCTRRGKEWHWRGSVKARRTTGGGGQRGLVGERANKTEATNNDATSGRF